jgi:serine/threonine protein kinase
MDRYDVREELGDGSFGVVFRAIHKTSGEEVSLLPGQDVLQWNQCRHMSVHVAIVK